MISKEHFKTSIVSTGIPINATFQSSSGYNYTRLSHYDFTPPQEHFDVSLYMNSLVQQYLQTTTFHQMLHELGYMEDDKLQTCPFCNRSSFNYEFSPDGDEINPHANSSMSTFCDVCDVLLHHQSVNSETSDSYSDFFSGYLELISHDFSSASQKERGMANFKLAFLRGYAEMKRKLRIAYPLPELEYMHPFSFYRKIAEHVYRDPLQSLNDSLISIRRGEL